MDMVDWSRERAKRRIARREMENCYLERGTSAFLLDLGDDR